MSVDLTGFPPIIEDLEPIIGVEGALLLVEAFPGLRLHVPKHVHAEHRLAKLLGLGRAEQLVAVYAGTHIDVPRCAQALRAKRNAKMFAARALGATHTQLAIDFCMTERNVYEILSRAPPNPRQLDLFDRV